MTVDINAVENYLRDLQKNICQGLETFEPEERFKADKWQRELGGGGVTCTLAGGKVFEKAGVNFSYVYGDKLPPAATKERPELAGQAFKAMGVSLVIHPDNPYVPTSHANIRFFMTLGDNPVWWFGGGFDLTPYYGFEEDCIHWHQVAKDACLPFGDELYPRFKKACDDYFYLHHRDEARGIGGLFFDDFNELGFDDSFGFARSVGDAYIKAYAPIVEKRHSIGFSDTEKRFQKVRRGRYVEFNLVYDRGTLFGLQSKGRTESILVSMPPEVTWQYNHQETPGTPEARLYSDFLPAKDWLEN